MSPKSTSRTARWLSAAAAARSAAEAAEAALADVESAMSDLRDVQSEYQDWLDNLPENLAESTLGEKLNAVCDLDLEQDLETLLADVNEAIDEAEGMDLPLGFGRD